MNIRAIIIAAGEATRWGNHLGIPKHFAPIDGEPILLRTVRLIQERGVTDIWIVGPDDDRYRIAGTSLYVPTKNPKNNDADKFLNSRELWSDERRTIVFWGDCYLTDHAVDTILGDNRRQWNIFFRFGPSEITKCRWGEIFAHSFFPEHQQQHLEKLEYIAELANQGVLRRCGGWEHYRAMHLVVGRDINKHIRFSVGVDIDDFSDDFDYPQDYERFLAAWESAKQQKE